ncbi:MAG: hypothetical protein P8K78_04615, partial [Pirellulales bacterium]|nr:hypothetical protein [Pirellulales bacterium]
MYQWCRALLMAGWIAFGLNASAADIKETQLYHRIKTKLDQVRAIDTHDHLRAFGKLPDRVDTDRGRGFNLYSIWAHSYLTRTTKITPWPSDGSFSTWWKQAHDDFDDAKATSFYRYLLPAFRDLYGVDFETMDDEEAPALNRRIFNNYQNEKWLIDVVTKRANIELMFIDPYWNRLQFARDYRFAVPVLNVTTLIGASHPRRTPSARDNPYIYAERKKLSTETFDDFLAVIDALFADARQADAICLKSTQAYTRT